MARGGAACRRHRERPARPRRPQGRRVRHPRVDESRVVPVRLRARPDRRDRRTGVREQLGPRCRLRPRARGGGGSAGRGRRAARQDRVGARGVADDRASAHVRRPAGVGGPGSRVRGDDSGGARRGRGARRRGGALHLHLHLRYDRAAEGLHDPPPQLLRDGDRRRQDGTAVRRPGGHAAPLPAARAQLRAADPPPGDPRRLHAGVLPRPTRVGEALLAVRPTTFPSVPRVYEKIHTAVVAGFADAHGPSRSIGQWALRVGREVSRAPPGGRSDPAPARAAAPDRGPARLLEGQGAARRPPSPCELGRRTALTRRDRALRAPSISRSTRATA